MSVPAAFITVIVIWTTTPLAIKWGASELGPVTALLLRSFIGIAVGMAIVCLLRIEMPWNRKALTSYVAGATGFCSVSTAVASGGVVLTVKLTSCVGIASTKLCHCLAGRVWRKLLIQ